MVTHRIATLALVLASAAWPHHADAASCNGDSGADGAFIEVDVSCSTDHDESPSGSTPSKYTKYRWLEMCGQLRDDNNENQECVNGINTCPPGQSMTTLEGLQIDQWVVITKRCRGQNAAPTITPALVATAFQQIPLPALRSITQPTDKTLVNFETLFRVEASPIDRTITLLGQQVDLDIRPTSFRWVHGDGTATVTDRPGRPYPAKDNVHRYQRAGVTVSQHVEVIWTAKWRLGGGSWADVPGTVTTVGPATNLQILEAAPALSGEGH